MALDDLNKDTSGASLIKSFKDIFPGKLEKLFIYKGINLVSKGNEVFSREDTTTYIALELLGEADVIFGGESLTSTLRTITESKSVKETARQKLSTNSVTAFLRDLGNIDLTQHNLYYTVGVPFSQSDLTQDQLEVLSDAQIVPNLLEKLISGTNPLSSTQRNLIQNNKTASFTLSPAVIDNNLPASIIRFVDESIYKVLPTEEKDFEITSIDLESDQSFALEYGNGVKARGIIENAAGNEVERDLDFRMDKPLLALQINPYAKFSNIQFAIENFNYYQRMPFLSAKHFLGADRSIKTFIIGSETGTWAVDLAKAVQDMFVMSWAISTGFQAYRDSNNNNEINNSVIGGVSLKTMEGKDPDKLFAYVDQILRNWEYANNVQYKKTEAYKRALQVLASSSEVVQSSYCVGKGLTEFHKTIFDFWLNLDTIISENVPDIKMTLQSYRYVFTYEEDSSGAPDLTKPIINHSPILGISRSVVTNFGRQTSMVELDDPISITGFTNFAGDIDPTKADATKYFIGIDVTDPDKIATILGLEETDSKDTHHVNKDFESSWYAPKYNKQPSNNYGSNIIGTISNGQQYDASKILDSEKQTYQGQTPGTIPAPVFTEDEMKVLIRKELDIPPNATNLQINYDNLSIVTETASFKFDQYDIKYNVQLNQATYRASIVKFVGTVVTYDITTTVHGVADKQQNYDKSEFLNMVIKFSGTDLWKRNLELDENWRDENGVQTSKIKSINHIFISSFLGDYLDIKLNYKYKDDQGVEQTGTTLLPRIDLPAKDDERRTKLGIRL